MEKGFNLWNPTQPKASFFTSKIVWSQPGEDNQKATFRVKALGSIRPNKKALVYHPENTHVGVVSDIELFAFVSCLHTRYKTAQL